MTVKDFKERIAIMMREKETGKKFSVIGAAPARENVLVRTKQNGRNGNTGKRKV